MPALPQSGSVLDARSVRTDPEFSRTDPEFSRTDPESSRIDPGLIRIDPSDKIGKIFLQKLGSDLVVQSSR